MDVFTPGEEECSCVLARVGSRTSLFQLELSFEFPDRSGSNRWYCCWCLSQSRCLRRETPKGPSICWTFGFGENGQLGHGSTKSSSTPEPVSELPEHAYLVSVDCGLFHTSVVSSEGYVWSWGMERGLGLCPDMNFTEVEAGDDSAPRKISGGSRFRDPVQVSCGAALTVLVANGGYKLWSWGRGRDRVLGTGNVMDYYVPTLVFWPPDELKPDNEEVLEPDADKSSSTEEIKRLESKLMVMERYASILHGSIFGKPFNEEEDIPYSLRVSIWEKSGERCWRVQIKVSL